MGRTKGKMKASAASSTASKYLHHFVCFTSTNRPQPRDLPLQSPSRLLAKAQLDAPKWPSLLEIPDSDSIGSSSPARSSSRPGSFRGVYLSNPRASSSRKKTVIANLSGSSSIADSSEAIEYETPGTSTMNTPAVEASSSKAKVGASARALELRMSGNLGTRSTSKKRKNIDEIEVEDNDAILAARLQAEEYGLVSTNDSEDDQPLAKRRRGSRQNPVNLTSDEDEDEEEDDFEPPVRNRGRARPPPVLVKKPKGLKPVLERGDSTELSDLSVPPSAESSDFDDDMDSIAESQVSVDSATATAAPCQCSCDYPPTMGHELSSTFTFRTQN